MSIETAPTAQPTVVVDPVFDDPGRLRALFERSGPYWNQGRYLTAAGAASQMPSGTTSTAGIPWFRQDWALGGEPLVDGAAELLHLPAFIDAAEKVFAGTVVRPHTLYANVQVPTRATDEGHTDVPEFRGVTRDRYPVALLHVMNRSGLFTRWQLPICTAVTWLWDGPGGEFLLWEHGPDQPATAFGPSLTNKAVVADNDRVFHGIGDFAIDAGPRPEQLTADSEVVSVDGTWQLRRAGAPTTTESVVSWPAHTVRLSVSWKAYVFADGAAARAYDEHTDDLDEAQVVDTFVRALAERGTPFTGRPALGEELLFALGSAWPKRLPVAARPA
jgi:hypothetical protein